ncbi:MAG TPA: T9SS type A sorting domain-containing protein [Bacteroidota bacterium]
MRHLVIVLLLGLFVAVPVYGQNELIVEPADISGKTLDETVRGDTTAGGQRVNLERIYVLRRGAIYLVSSSIQNTGYPLRMRAEDGTGAKPQINIIRGGTGAYAAQIFQADSLLDLKNLTMNGWDEGFEEFSVYQSRIINVNRIGTQVYVDSCILNGSTATLIQTSVAAQYLRATNSIFANGGNVRANNLGNGRAIDFRNVSIDSAFIQNCSFLNFQDRVFRHFGAGQVPINNFTVDHNTFVNDLAEHGCIGIGAVGGTITITNNLFVDHFVLGNDSTAYQGASSRLAEFGDTGERGPNGQFRMTFVGSIPDETTEFVIHNNYYSVSPSLQAFYDSRNDSSDAGIGDLIPLTWHINGKLGADSANAFTKVATPITFTDAPATPIAFAEWFFTPHDEGGAGKQKVNDTFLPEYDFDRRDLAYFRDTLDLAYQTASEAYTAAVGGFPVGDLNWFPTRKSDWVTYVTSVEDIGGAIPQNFTLDQNYPNPFNPSTKIRFSLPNSGNVVLKVFNMLGQEVVTLMNEKREAGNHEFTFDASRLSSGVYVYRLTSGNFVASRKMVLIK